MKHKGFNKKELKILALSSLGGTLEFYDFIIFVFFANIISIHFFPENLSDTWKLIHAYGIFAAGYLARPLGGIFMAHFGDKFGRKNVFMLSILLMVIPTFALAFVPGFEHIGYLAPIILLVIRIAQGIAVGGELPGAWVFIQEHAPTKQKNLYISLLCASVTAGIFLGALVYLLIYTIFSEEEVKNWAWRVAFGIGGVFGIISVYLRKFLEETPVFLQMKNDNALLSFPLKELFKRKNSSFAITVSMLSTWVLTACILLFVLQLPNFVADVLKFNPFEKTYFQILGLCCLIFCIVLIGFLSDKFSPYKVCIVFCIGFGVFSFLFVKEFYSLHTNINLLLLYYALSCFFSGIMTCCPIFMSDVFEAKFRFSGISFSYNIAYAISGYFTPQLAVFLHILSMQNKGEILSLSLSFYTIFICFIGILGSLLSKRFYKNTDNKSQTS